jgi:glutaredoxin-like protein NrdH
MPEIDIPTLTIFSKPGCVQCNAAERHAIAKKIPYQKIDVTTTPEALELVSSWGYQKAPVLYYNGEHVPGFDPAFIEQVAA